MCGDKNFFYNFDDQDNKFVEIIDYISEGICTKNYKKKNCKAKSGRGKSFTDCFYRRSPGG